MRNSVVTQALRHHKWTILLGVIQGIAGGYLTILIYRIIGSFTNDILYQPEEMTFRSAAYFILALLGSILLLPLLQYIKNILLFRNALEHDHYILHQFIHLRPERIKEFKEGDMQYRLERDPNEFRFAVLAVFTKIPVSAIVGAGIVMQLIWIHMVYALVCLIVAAVPLLANRVKKRLEAEYKMKTRDYEMSSRNLELDMVHGAGYLKLFQLRSGFLRLFAKRFQQYYTSRLQHHMRLQYMLERLDSLTGLLTSAIIILCGAWLVAASYIEAGYIMTVFGLSNTLKTLFLDLDAALKSYHMMQIYLPKLSEISERETHANLIRVEEGPFTLEGEHISFQYEEGHPLLASIDFQIRQGDKVAIVGPNGRGKSTLMQIMAGLLKPCSGKLTVNHVDLSQIDLPSYFAQYAYAEQSPYLFEDSVYNNVKLARPEASDKEVARVLDRTGLSHMSALGLEIQNSSGGEKQRISVARALLKNSHLIFLDEPYHDLDQQGKELVREIITTPGRTVVFISHEDELTALANQVIRL